MDNHIFDSMDQLDKLKVPYCLCASTLLAFILQRKPFDNDPEMDFMFPVEYRTTILTSPLKFYFIDKQAVTGLGGGGFERQGDEFKTGLTFIIKKGKYAIANFWGDCFSICNYDWIFPFIYIEHKGRQVPVPNKYEEILRLSYGDNWKVRQLNWHHDPNDPKVIHSSSLDEAIKKYEQH